MKPGNLLVQGAKSDGKRKMRIRYHAHRIFGVHFSFSEHSKGPLAERGLSAKLTGGLPPKAAVALRATNPSGPAGHLPLDKGGFLVKT